MNKMKFNFSRVLVFVVTLLFSSLSVSAQTPSECDRLAAHPEDPNKLSEGVEDQSPELAQAIEPCRQEVGANPESGRLWFQLGRAYWDADKNDLAIEAFTKSALELNYGPAQTYLAFAYEFGFVTGEIDENAARILYWMSSESGFEPATSRLENIPLPRPLFVEDENGDIAAFRFSAYKQPKILKALYMRDFDHLNENSMKTLLYLKGMHEFFSQGTIWQNMSCAYIQDTRMTQKVIRAITGGDANSVARNSAAIFSRLKKQFESRMSKGLGGLIKAGLDYMEIQSLADDGKLDSGKLAESQKDKKCDSEEMKILYKNAQFYVLKQMTFTR